MTEEARIAVPCCNGPDRDLQLAEHAGLLLAYRDAAERHALRLVGAKSLAKDAIIRSRHHGRQEPTPPATPPPAPETWT